MRRRRERRREPTSQWVLGFRSGLGIMAGAVTPATATGIRDIIPTDIIGRTIPQWDTVTIAGHITAGHTTAGRITGIMAVKFITVAVTAKRAHNQQGYLS